MQRQGEEKDLLVSVVSVRILGTLVGSGLTDWGGSGRERRAMGAVLLWNGPRRGGRYQSRSARVYQRSRQCCVS